MNGSFDVVSDEGFRVVVVLGVCILFVTVVDEASNVVSTRYHEKRNCL